MTKYNYNPDDALQIVPAGNYDAVVFSAKTGETKKGAPKLDMTLKVYDPKGVNPLVRDTIMSPFGIRRLKQLCEATGVDFSGGEVDPEEFPGKNVQVRLCVRTDPTGQYDDQNSVSAYLSDDVQVISQAASAPTVGKREAWMGYCENVRKDVPTAKDELLADNFKAACKTLVGDKPESDYIEADWIKVREEGPKQFLPI